MQDKNALLKQLTIDRSVPDEQSSGISLTTLIVAICVSVVATFSLAYWWFNPSAVNPQPTAPTATVKPRVEDVATLSPADSTPVPKTKKDNQSVLDASGYVTARRMATVSAEIMGRITDVKVEEGMTVESGQVLATLDNDMATVNFNMAEAQIAVLSARKVAIQADLAEAQRNERRALNNEFSSDAERTGSTAQVLNLKANLAAADADIQVAELELSRQRENLDNHTIRAPFAGIVTVKNAQPGEIVAPASAGGGFTRTGICTIVDMDSLEIEVDVNEAFIGRVSAGQRVEARLDAYPEWTIPASVIAIIPTADRSKATVQVRVGIDISDTRILPDMGVKVAFLKT